MRKIGIFAVAALISVLRLSASAQEFPFEQKAKFERAMEEKAESVLLRILGPNRYRVVVDATLDFTRIEKFDIKSGQMAGGKAEGTTFLWEKVGAESASSTELLPGIPAPQKIPDFTETRSYQRQNSFPEVFIKRLSVTVILDNTVPTEQGDQLTPVIKEILDIQPDREDGFRIAYAPFAPAWKTVWYMPETASLMFKYGLISLMTLITLVVVAACFLKLAEAMDSMAQAQTTQFQMDSGEKPAAEEGETAHGTAAGEGGEQAPAPAKVVFNVGIEQVDTLTEILGQQDAENIALVVAHLKPAVKKAFLSRLQGKVYSQVLMSLGKIRFMDPDIVATVKDELERRLESAVGGHGKLLEMIEESDLKAQKELLAFLEANDPQLAALVRGRILLFDDILQMEPREWSILLSAVPLDDWSRALSTADTSLRDAVEAQMLPRTWAILLQMMETTKPAPVIVEEARERVIKSIRRLIAEGRIGNIVERRVGVIPVQAEVDAPPPMMEEPGALAG